MPDLACGGGGGGEVGAGRLLRKGGEGGASHASGTGHKMNDKQFSTGVKKKSHSLRLNHRAPIRDLDDK